MWIAAFLITVSLLLAAVAGLVFFAVARRHAQRRVWELQAERDELRADLESLRERNHELDKQIASYKAQFENLDDRFTSLATKAIHETGERFQKQFFDLAKKTFEGEQKEASAALEQRKQAIEQMLKPIRESLERHAKAVTEIEKSREGAYHALRQQMTSMVEDQRRLRGETENLVKALRRPDVRGRWGEMQLRRVAELAGMIDYCDFTEQPSVGEGESRQRPDMVVHLPAGREIVVDAKTPIEAFLSAIEATDDEERERQLDRHVRHIETQVQSLSSKGYQTQFARTPDFVVLFIPGESFLEAAVRRKPELLEQAMNRNVLVATPSTLIGLLKAVASGWREQQLAENARRISKLGQELHERVATLTEHLQKLGGSLHTTLKHYNTLVGSYESRVLVSARRFKELGADSSKELPAEGEVDRVETTPREVNQPEA